MSCFLGFSCSMSYPTLPKLNLWHAFLDLQARLLKFQGRKPVNYCAIHTLPAYAASPRRFTHAHFLGLGNTCMLQMCAYSRHLNASHVHTFLAQAAPVYQTRMHSGVKLTAYTPQKI